MAGSGPPRSDSGCSVPAGSCSNPAPRAYLSPLTSQLSGAQSGDRLGGGETPHSKCPSPLPEGAPKKCAPPRPLGISHPRELD